MIYLLILSGSGVALVTPFTNKNNINFEKLDELISFHLENNTDFIVPCGTTGEASTLSTLEKKKLIKFTVDKCKGKIPVIAGTGSNNTKQAIEMSRYAKTVGADGVLVVTPYYNKTNQEGLFVHYKKIADAIFPLPLILYNVPIILTALHYTIYQVLSIFQYQVHQFRYNVFLLFRHPNEIFYLNLLNVLPNIYLVQIKASQIFII